jgi:hypothetical protein
MGFQCGKQFIAGPNSPATLQRAVDYAWSKGALVFAASPSALLSLRVRAQHRGQRDRFQRRRASFRFFELRRLDHPRRPRRRHSQLRRRRRLQLLERRLFRLPDCRRHRGAGPFRQPGPHERAGIVDPQEHRGPPPAPTAIPTSGGAASTRTAPSSSPTRRGFALPGGSLPAAPAVDRVDAGLMRNVLLLPGLR